MKLKLLSILAAAALWQSSVMAQGSLSPVLVGSAGNFTTAGNISISSSTGESAVQTLGPANSLFLTQGFQQPSSTGIVPLTASVVDSNSTCIGASNGFAVATVLTGKAPFKYKWLPLNDSIVTTALSDTITGLAPGTYVVVITDANNFSYTDTITVEEENTNCGVVVYSGITPNGDNHNDQWLIDYIELYPDNSVTIFNRWGQRVWHAEHYNNQDIVWRGTNEKEQPLPDATYYYVIKLEDKTLTGWVELTH